MGSVAVVSVLVAVVIVLADLVGTYCGERATR